MARVPVPFWQSGMCAMPGPAVAGEPAVARSPDRRIELEENKRRPPRGRCERTGDEMGRKQRISYVQPDAMDRRMRAEMDRCGREGTPRPESSAVRAHVPACFWAFANSWRDIFKNGVCDHSIKELCRLYVS